MRIVVGTSGHIDHGKTTLIRALTGVDADRWSEEKRRGITIDLGFARYRDAEGTDIAFVDVPGHERFVHNMLAGAAGMDAVLLVVAADEGVMPQTREHLHICDLLGLQRGLVALTRVDLADEELVALSTEDVREAVAGSFLEGAPVVPVSAVTGEGLERLRAELSAVARSVRERDTEHPFRFPVDRSFTIKGFGTVVTGTVTAGRVGKDDPVMLYPRGAPVRIRGMQVHGEAADTVSAGQRAAINLAGVAKEDVQRGDQLAAPASLLGSHMLNVELRLLADAPRHLTQRTRVRVHLGTQEVIGRVVLLTDEALAPGQTQLAQLRLESVASTRYGDRFIVRNYSPIHTLGGGRVIDPAPSKSRRIRAELAERLQALQGGDPEALVEQAIYLQGTRGVKGTEGFIRTGLSGKQFDRMVSKLSSQGQVVCVDPQAEKYVHAAALERVAGFIQRVLAQHHRAFPEREGMTRPELAGKLSLIFDEKEVGVVLQRLAKQGHVVQHGQAYRQPGHERSVSGEQEQGLERLLELVRQGGVQPPRRTNLFEAAGLDDRTGTRLLKLATHNDRLVRVKEDLYYPPDVLADIEQRLRDHLAANETINVIAFKDLIGVTRKHAVDLLEHFDAAHVTLRVGDERVLRRAPAKRETGS